MNKYRMKLTEKDVCLCIATYNRPDDVKQTLNSLIKYGNIPGKIIIVDQSKNNKTKKVVASFKKLLPIEYIFCQIPSADISMNIGIIKARDKFKVILTSGDDIDFLKDYLKEIINEFNNNPKVMAIGGIDKPLNNNLLNKLSNKFSNMLLRLVFLPIIENHKFRITGPYGNTYSPRVTKKISDAQWIPGFNMAARSEVYKDYLWPEIRGYNVLDDIDSSYTIYKKYGFGSLNISPKCKTIHRYSQTERYPEKKRIFVNHEDHFIFYYRHFNTFLGTLKMIWSIVGITFGNLLFFIVRPKRENFLRLKYNLEAIIYCYKNKQRIKKGIFRSFLDNDLKLRKEYA